MANMSYCRFENTFRDLEDCDEAFENELSERESKYRKYLYELCKNIVTRYDESDFEDGGYFDRLTESNDDDDEEDD